jgi:hypothetical protein
VRAQDAAARERTARDEQRRSLAARVHGNDNGGEGGSGGSAGGGVTATAPVDVEAIAAAAARGTTAAIVAAMGSRLPGGVAQVTERATRLSTARQHAPVVLPANRPRQSVTAGVDIPGIARGAELETLEQVVEAFHRRAKGMPITRDGNGQSQLVVTLRNDFDHTVDERTSPGAVDELLKHMLTADKKAALVAGGGWCAPSEIRYDFFNIACVDGLIDLPTVGITRGGIRIPTSPSLADATPGLGGFASTFANTTNPWLWTETDDINTVTGSTNKPVIRVPCPSFTETRLECYGITLTAGNLTDSAYPETTQNFLRLLMTAHDHAQNQRIISQMVSLSTAAISGGGFAEANDVVTQVLSGIELAAVDYRAKFGMCLDDVLEVVAPFWLKAVLRAGFLWRHEEYEDTSVADAEIQRFFTDRNVRVQWVNDWQVRGSSQFGNATTPMTAWPVSAQVLVYAAGTFLLGNGLTLDLGVVRDSVLNAENDFTAAWSEECHLVAKVGHESRLYTIAFQVSRLLANSSDSTAGNL